MALSVQGERLPTLQVNKIKFGYCLSIELFHIKWTCNWTIWELFDVQI